MRKMKINNRCFIISLNFGYKVTNNFAESDYPALSFYNRNFTKCYIWGFTGRIYLEDKGKKAIFAVQKLKFLNVTS